MSRRDRRRLRDMQRYLGIALDLMQEALLALDTKYATQEMAWQEGPAGRLCCEASDELRERIEVLRRFEWTAVGRLL